MKTNYWMWIAIALANVLFWQVYSRHSVAAQSWKTAQITKLTDVSGPVKVPGEVVGFSCIGQVYANLVKGEGIIDTRRAECYVLSK